MSYKLTRKSTVRILRDISYSNWPTNIWQRTDRNSIIRGALLETRIVIDAALSWQTFQIRVSLPSLFFNTRVSNLSMLQVSDFFSVYLVKSQIFLTKLILSLVQITIYFHCIVLIIIICIEYVSIHNRFYSLSVKKWLYKRWSKSR